jgi:hypothetical protein
MPGHSPLSLKFDFLFEDLYRRDGLERIDKTFLETLRASSADLHDRLVAVRADPASLSEKPASELLVEVAPYLEDFIGDLFGIEAELRQLQARHAELRPAETYRPEAG